LKIYAVHKVESVWVKGHAGNEFNEVADRLAVSAYADGILPLEIDEAYERLSGQKSLDLPSEE
jgi:ribonuclease HI